MENPSMEIVGADMIRPRAIDNRPYEFYRRIFALQYIF